MTATDNFSWETQHKRMFLVYPVEKLDAVEAAQNSPADFMVISWPPYGDETIFEVCKAWGSKRPIVYIGENGGCNAPDDFFDHFREEHEIEIPQWRGIHDHCWIGRYNKENHD